MSSLVFPMAGRFNSKISPTGRHHADAAMLPYVITQQKEEVLFFQAKRMGLAEAIIMDEYISRTALSNFADKAGVDITPNLVDEHGVYYCFFDYMKVFIKEGPTWFAIYVLLDDDSPLMIVKHFSGFRDMFVLLRGRLLSYEESLTVAYGNERAYNTLNRVGPPPQRILDSCVFVDKKPKPTRLKAFRNVKKVGA